MRCGAALLLAAPAVAAQDGVDVDVAPDLSPRAAATGWRSLACMATVPDSALSPLLVLLDARASGGDLAPPPVGDALAALVGERLRAYLGGGDDTLPAGEPVVHWMDVPIALDVILRRNGDHDWTMPDSVHAGDTRPTELRYLLMRAVAEVRDAGPRLAVPVDSTVVRLRLRHPLPAAPEFAIHLVGLPDAGGVPVFTLGVPRESPVRVRRTSPPSYPSRAHQEGVSAVVGLDFVVSPDGRAVPASIREVSPRTQRQMARFGPQRRYGVSMPPESGANPFVHHAAFVAAARQGVLRMRFEPARIGDCPVEQSVQQPFVFGFRP